MPTTMTTTNTYANLVQAAQLAQAANTPGATPVDIAPYWVAIGTGTTAPAATDTGLVAEVFRKAVTSVAAGASPGELIITMYLGPTDSVGTVIGEVGVFAGATASATAGSGVLMGRALYSHTHTNAESISIPVTWTNQQV